MSLLFDHRAFVARDVTQGAYRVARYALAASLTSAAGVSAYDAVPQARVTTKVQNILTVTNSWFGSAGRQQGVYVRLARKAGEAVIIRLDGDCAKDYVLNSTLPVADTVSSGSDGAVLTFDSHLNSDVFEIALTITPDAWGRHTIRLNAAVAQRFAVMASVDQVIAPF